MSNEARLLEIIWNHEDIISNYPILDEAISDIIKLLQTQREEIEILTHKLNNQSHISRSSVKETSNYIQDEDGFVTNVTKKTKI